MAHATSDLSPGLLNTDELSINDCKFCGANVKNPCVCKKCKNVFHPSYFNHAVEAKNQTCVHEKDVALSFSTNSSDVIMEFLKSNEFQDIVTYAVSVETKKIRQQMMELKAEVENLKLSNIDLVRVMHGTSVV
jgi:methionyl-tRNA synthetase